MKKRIIASVLSFLLILGSIPMLSARASAQVNFKSTISAGGFHSLAIKTNGALWAWGRNQYGQVGDGSTTNRTSPIQIMEDVELVSAGWSYSLALKNDGTLWAWGQNGYGQLGDGSYTDRYVPKQIMSEVASVSAGDTYTMILKNDGTLWACGDNDYGQLGDGSTTARSTPVQIMSNVANVSAGDNHTLAVKTDGTLWSWGKNGCGQLGDGDTTSKYTPEKIMSEVTVASAGGVHSLAIKSDGTLWAWGSNYFGQLGDGAKIANFIGEANTDRSTPVKIMGEVAAVSAGNDCTMILKTDGTLWACGNNYSGQLGNGLSENRSTPVLIESNIAAASAGVMHSMAVKTDGTLYTWGDNTFGQLGDKTTAKQTSPLLIMSNVATAASEGAGSSSHSNNNVGLSNFVNMNTYTPGKFTDVPTDSWFAKNVATAYELGLMKGNSDTYFNASGNTSIAEAVVLACRLHSIYYADGKEFTQGSPWYQSYIDYAFDNGILSYAFSDYSKAATRAEFAIILSKALPSEALSVINAIPDDTIPDIPSSTSYSKGVYCLYRAGVITGSDSIGTFNPNSTIGRNEVAAIVTRMAIENLRKSVAFEKITPTGITISQTSLSIEAGKTVTLTAMVSPSNAADKSVKWSSSNYSVATVNNAVVKGLTAGTATITATTSNGFTAQCLVTVSSSVVYYSGYYPAPDFGAYMNVNAFATGSTDKMTMFVYKAQDITVSSEIALKGYLDLLFENGFYYVTKRYDSENMPVLIYKNDAYGVYVLITCGITYGYASVKIAVTNASSF